MDRFSVIAIFFQGLGNDIHIRLAVAEDDRVGASLTLGIDHRAQQVALFLGLGILAAAFEHDHSLGDILAGRSGAGDLDLGGGGEEGICDPLNLGRHGGREEQGLTGKGCQAENPLNIGNEPHVEHAVSLVHHHDLDAGQEQLTTLKMVKQAARCGDQHVNAPVDQQVLLLKADAADQKGLGQLRMLGIGVKVLGNLGGKLARGAKHQAAWHARAGAATAK